ncbi:MAG TPA: glycosyltransferase [Terriglobales bacterium]|nr:glycosyltransferase [Terriglobales bacterium]
MTISMNGSLVGEESTAAVISAVETAGSGGGHQLHVLTLTPFYPHQNDSAAGCFVAEPLAHLQDLGVESSVIAVQPFHRGRMTASQLVHPSSWVHYVSLPGVLGLTISGPLLSKQIFTSVSRLHLQCPIDLIHAHAPLPCGYAAFLLQRKLGIPFVVSVHGREVFSDSAGGPWARNRCRRMAKMVYRSARRVICVSETVRQELRNGVPEADCTVVYNGTDSTLFRPVTGIDAPLVLSVGNLLPSKGHEVLLRAFAKVAPSHPRLAWQIIGIGPEYGRLRLVARELGIEDRAQFLGRLNRDAVAEAMRRCAVFALPSSCEALGCVYLEAMAAGKAVIGCHGQGIAEIVRNGQNGFLIEPGNIEELAGVLGLLLREASLRARVGAAARATILEGLTLEHQAAHLARVYRECVA